MRALIQKSFINFEDNNTGNLTVLMPIVYYNFSLLSLTQPFFHYVVSLTLTPYQPTQLFNSHILSMQIRVQDFHDV